MSEGLPLIIVDDDPAVCEVTAGYIKSFYKWGGHPAVSGGTGIGPGREILSLRRKG